ncbi:hypothetical protein KAU92_01960 [Candidatus Bathyarchaeota archaeon]|nr:hypothetical protein [Candidatus Bathyarchaeota archaeon]
MENFPCFFAIRLYVVMYWYRDSDIAMSVDARKERIDAMWNLALELSKYQIEHKEGKYIDKRKFYAKLMRQLGVRKQRLEDYYDIFIVEESFIEQDKNTFYVADIEQLLDAQAKREQARQNRDKKIAESIIERETESEKP